MAHAERLLKLREEQAETLQQISDCLEAIRQERSE